MLQKRVLLDYPLDILLNRQCSLKAHEAGLLELLDAYETYVEKSMGELDERSINWIWEALTKPVAVPGNVNFPAAVKDWKAAAQGNWQKAIPDSTVFGQFCKAVSTAPGVASVDSVEGKVFGFHVILGARTLGSLLLPEPARPMVPGAVGSGNILIEGTPGSGKSTLALQIAIGFASWPNAYNVIYITLEQTVADLQSKAKALSPHWNDKLRPVLFLDDVEDDCSDERIGLELERLLQQGPDCPICKGTSCQEACSAKPCEHPARVLLPALSPPTLAGHSTHAGENALFWERLAQLEKLLTGARWLREHRRELRPIGLLCVDSLNIFGERVLKREELWRLFDMFRQYGVMGLCTVEPGAETEEMASSDLIDILIRLKTSMAAGYFTRYLEIVKSRYQHQIYGLHPFKIRREADVEREWQHSDVKEPDRRMPVFQAVKIFPSIHCVVAETDPVQVKVQDAPESVPPAQIGNSRQDASKQRVDKSADDRLPFDFGIEALRHIIAPRLRRNSVLAIVGERNTYKTRLARHFLMYGLSQGRVVNGETEKEQESALLIRLHERTSFAPAHRWMLGDDLFDKDVPLIKSEWFNKVGPWLESSKLIQRCYEYSSNKDHSGPWFVELALKSGALLPEEFLQFVRNIIRRVRRGAPAYPIRRVVLDDVSLIGASYPFLRQSENAGDLFLSAFVHVMRNQEVDLVLLGTTTGLHEAEEMVNRARTLADEVITSEFCDVFGDRYVTLRGGGLAAAEEGVLVKQSEKHYEMVPGVVIPDHANGKFRIDLGVLKGLVGFANNRIHRPGLTLHTFQENPRLHGTYNQQLRELISTALGATATAGGRVFDEGKTTTEESARPGPLSRAESVDLVPFDARDNEPFHDGLELMAGRPIDKTIVATVDEFFVTSERLVGSRIFAPFPEPLFNETCDAALPSVRSRLKLAKESVVLPYYANALLVAFNTKQISASEVCSGDSPPRLKRWSELTRRTPIPVVAWDRVAWETGASLLLDIVGPRERDKWEDFAAEPVAQLRQRVKDDWDEILADLEAVEKLLGDPADVTTDPKKADLCVFWYSQLRDLIAKRQVAAADLDVCSLPGGGFTGDWYIGVVDGSVSISLGQQLVKMLCRRKEEYKRLNQGVGLPTIDSFYGKDAGFLAWPEGNVRLSALKEIHETARSRAAVRGYQLIKGVLYRAWDELQRQTPPERILRELPVKIEILAQEGS